MSHLISRLAMDNIITDTKNLLPLNFEVGVKLEYATTCWSRLL